MRRLFYLILVLLIAHLCISLEASPKKKDDISEKNRSLAELQDKLKAKKSEQEKYKKDEKRISKELDIISKELEQIQTHGEKIRRDIIKAENILKITEKELDASRWEKSRWAGAVKFETNLWYREYFSYKKLFNDNVNEKLMFQAIEQKKNYFASALDREMNSQIVLEKWQTAQRQLMNLKARQEEMAVRKSSVQSQKKNLLKTTAGRRVVAEKEIQELSESGKALKDFIAKLEIERKEKEKEEKKVKTKEKVRLKRKRISWPLQGNIVAKFGKNKHPDLDTYVISNGIKISARPGAEVRAALKGEIVFTGEFRTYGLMIIMDNGGGLYTIYGHLGTINVQENMKIKEGDIIGQITSLENPILYFEIRYNGKVDDPLLWLKK
ncbi:MAG: peptidoglycan DD-metalloendopeptidase family protein [Elusimicrobia bacterium]|nr:peptidoglycan DD-metalloendopeptidase family protein [Elusimicrobiota bacterium]